jgi:formylglycine-generating enzyme required for sulfatase activity
MHGNVWQWCSTTRSIVDSYRSADPVTDPPDPEVQSGSRGAAANHILRGGSWVYPAQKCRSATRGFDGTGPWYEGYGFRVVVEAKQSL